MDVLQVKNLTKKFGRQTGKFTIINQYKAIIIGASLTGKTTLIKYLRNTTNLNIQEIDEDLTSLNNGSYPKDDNYKNTNLAPKIKALVLDKEKVLFFTNTHYFSSKELQSARQKGFKIIQIVIDKDELIKRNKQRVMHEGYENHSQWFDSMLKYQKEMKDKRLIDKVIKTNKPVEVIAQELIAFLDKLN